MNVQVIGRKISSLKKASEATTSGLLPVELRVCQRSVDQKVDEVAPGLDGQHHASLSHYRSSLSLVLYVKGM